jgi:hypothetical protein
MKQSHSIDWFAAGDAQTVVIGDQEIHIRFVGRKGRRGRIAITAPEGATFIKRPAAPKEDARADR